MPTPDLRRLALALCSLLVAACAAPPAGRSEAAATKVALVIGNAAYDHVPALKNPGNDARDMCAALSRLGFQTLCHTDLRDRAAFDARVGEYLARLGPSTVGVVFYSGHGVQAGGANFLIPTQVQLRAATDDPLRVLYGLDDLFARLRPHRARFQLVILDACRTDLFAPPPRGQTRSALVRSLEGNARAATGLAPIQHAPAETMVLYASAAGEAAYDGTGANGPLTKHVLANIGIHGLNVQQFLSRVTGGVAAETVRAQTPYIYGSFGGEFCFAGCRFNPPPIN
jgi:uncharacterized caspase-like protein